MTKLDIFTTKGAKKSSGMSLPKELSEKENLTLLAQAVRVYENRIHAKSAKTKRRGEIKASKRKIYAQKGTGRARHGAISAPIFVGGAKAHGPDGRSRTLRLSKKMAKKALSVALTQKANEGTLLVIEGLDSVKKTKEAGLFLKKILSAIKKENCKNVTMAISKKSTNSIIYLRNLDGVNIELFSDLNAYKVFKCEVLIVDDTVLTAKDKKTETKKELKKAAIKTKK